MLDFLRWHHSYRLCRLDLAFRKPHFDLSKVHLITFARTQTLGGGLPELHRDDSPEPLFRLLEPYFALLKPYFALSTFRLINLPGGWVTRRYPPPSYRARCGAGEGLVNSDHLTKL